MFRPHAPTILLSSNPKEVEIHRFQKFKKKSPNYPCQEKVTQLSVKKSPKYPCTPHDKITSQEKITQLSVYASSDNNS